MMPSNSCKPTPLRGAATPLHVRPPGIVDRVKEAHQCPD